MSQLLNRVAFRRKSDQSICIATWNAEDSFITKDLDEGLQYQIEIGNIIPYLFTFEYFTDNGEFEGRDYLNEGRDNCGDCLFDKDTTDEEFTQFAIKNC